VIAVVGSVNADLNLTVDHLPVEGDTVLARGAAWAPGGKGANQASAAGRLDARVHLIAAVGDDATAGVALDGLDHIDTSAVRRVAGEPTGVAAVCVDARGGNLIVVAPGANAALTAADVRLPAGCAAVLVSLEIAPAAALAALQAARAAGALAVLNAAPADAADADLLAAADVVIGNEGEAAAVAATSGDGDLGTLATRLGATVVATAGPAGVQARTADGGSHHVPAMPADVVDTVGAGDCFAAALTVALAEGADLEAALRFATAAATVKVGRAGARSTPTRAEVDALLR
jgi:ribokinase